MIRPLGHEDAGEVLRVVSAMPGFGDWVDAEGWRRTLDGVGPENAYVLGVGTPLRSIIALRPLRPRPRVAHSARVSLRAANQRDAKALLAALCEGSDRFLGFARLEASAETEATWAPALREAGFVPEVCRRAVAERAGAPRDAWLWGRLRPGFDAGTPAPLVLGPRPKRRATVSVRLRRESDHPAMLRGHRDDSVLWGTNLCPWMSEDRWRVMVSRAAELALVAELRGAYAGSLTLIRINDLGGFGLGMSVPATAQGRGAGRALMAEALEEAWGRLEASRIELEVWTDNTRAIALYRSFGFVDEGVRRAVSWRDGGYADSLSMALMRSEAVVA